MKKRTWKKSVACLLAGAMVITSAGFTGTKADAAKKKKAVKATLSMKGVSIYTGKKATLKITKKNVKKVKKVTWSVKNKKIATVSKKGVVTAKKVGKTTVTAKVTYIAKKAKKSSKKTLKCTVTVKKKKAKKTPAPAKKTPVPTATPGTDEPSTSPSTEPSASPSTEPSTAPSTKPSTAPSTKPSTAPSTKPSTAPTTAPTTAPKATQTLKISVKSGSTLLDINADKITVTDANSKAVTVTKGSDKTFTTGKLEAGTYKVSVAAVTVGKVSYDPIEKSVTIAADAKDASQNVDIDLAYVLSDKSYKATAEIIKGTDETKSLSLGENNDARFEGVFTKGCVDTSETPNAEAGNWLTVDLSKIDVSGMYNPFITVTVNNGGNVNKIKLDADGNYATDGYYGWKSGALTFTAEELNTLGAVGLTFCDATKVEVSVVDKNALPTIDESVIPTGAVTFTDGQEYTIDLALKLPIKGQKIGEEAGFFVQCTKMDSSWSGDWMKLVEGTVDENGVAKIKIDKSAIESHIKDCTKGATLSDCLLKLYVPTILSDGTTTYDAVNTTIPYKFAE